MSDKKNPFDLAAMEEKVAKATDISARITAAPNQGWLIPIDKTQALRICYWFHSRGHQIYVQEYQRGENFSLVFGSDPGYSYGKEPSAVPEPQP